LVLVSFFVSFDNNFSASANGWKIPVGPTLFGPGRKCAAPIILRSINVKNATQINIGTITISNIIFRGNPLSKS